jgi:predicted Rossmann fold nucleotide-binding protein DprA/Smf involved in DNA uptake
MTEWQILLSRTPKPLELPKARKRHKVKAYEKLLQTPKTVDELCAALGLTLKGCSGVLSGMAKRGLVRRCGKVERDGSVGRSKVLWEWVK